MGGSQSTAATSRNSPSGGAIPGQPQPPASSSESQSQVQFQSPEFQEKLEFRNLSATTKGTGYKAAKLVIPGKTTVDLPKDNAGAGEGNNTIKGAFLDDVRMIDSRNSQRMPPLIKNEVDKAIANDAAKICYETEKKMARCVQDKLYTVWKCQKERDEYYACTWKYKNDPEVKNMMRWKYNMGTFHGEIVARRRLMQALWQEYFPDREITHEWANE